MTSVNISATQTLVTHTQFSDGKQSVDVIPFELGDNRVRVTLVTDHFSATAILNVAQNRDIFSALEMANINALADLFVHEDERYEFDAERTETIVRDEVAKLYTSPQLLDDYWELKDADFSRCASREAAVDLIRSLLPNIDEYDAYALAKYTKPSRKLFKVISAIRLIKAAVKQGLTGSLNRA